MKLTVKPTRRINGRFRVPADCDLAQRAAVLSLLCAGTSTFNNWPSGHAAAETVLSCVRQLGGVVSTEGSVVQISGSNLTEFSPQESVLDCADAPTAYWLLLGMLCGQQFFSTVNGYGGNRSAARLPVTEALRKMGAEIQEENDAAPELRISPAALQGGELKTASVLPDLKSAALMAGLFAEEQTTITEELPLPDCLERILPEYGIKCEIVHPTRPRSRREEILSGEVNVGNEEKFHKKIIVQAHRERPRPVDWMLPGGFSPAVPLISAAAATPKSEVAIVDVALNSTRTGLLKVLKRMGAEVTINRRRTENNEPVGDVSITGKLLKATRVSPTEIPSLVPEIPLLTVLAGSAIGVTVIRGTAELQQVGMLPQKAITEHLRRMGAKVAELEDGWAIEGPTEWRATEVDCEGNADVGLAFAVAGLFAEKETTIRNAECITSRFPDFQQILLSLAG